MSISAGGGFVFKTTMLGTFVELSVVGSKVFHKIEEESVVISFWLIKVDSVLAFSSGKSVVWIGTVVVFVDDVLFVGLVIVTVAFDGLLVAVVGLRFIGLIVKSSSS